MARDRAALRRRLQTRLESQERFGPNENCASYGQTGEHIVKNGRTRQGQQRYRCKACGRIFCGQPRGGKRGYPETQETGEFWKATAFDPASKLRVARAVGKRDQDVAELARTHF
jgi:hypothetical protein